MPRETTRSPLPSLPPPLHRLLARALRGDRLELPFLSDTSTQLLAICNDERTDARQLSELLQRDPALAAHILSVSNSAAYAPKEPIGSLQQAVSRLGIQSICEIAVAVSLKGRVFRAPGQEMRIRNLWMHSAAAGVYAKEVARQLRQNVDGAFMCGLMHDLGKPVVLQALLSAVAAVTERHVPAAIIEAAMDEFHEEIGSRLLRAWSLADWIGDAVAHHHDFTLAGSNIQQAMVTNLADHLSYWALDENAEDEDFPAELPVIEALGLYAHDITDLLQKRGRVLEVTEALL